MRSPLILLCLFAMVMASCGDDRRGRRGRRSRLLPQAEQPAGITELAKLLDEFRENLEDADFDDASDLIKEMEGKVKRADVATISHSDYADLSAAVERARTDLSAAEKQHAIAQIVEKTQEKLSEAGELNEDLIEDGPDEGDLDDLDDLLEELAELVEKGKPFGTDMGFAEFSQKRDIRIATFSTTATQYRWLFLATRQLNEALDGADGTVADDAEIDDRIDYADAMLSRYTACVETTRELALAKGFAPGLTVVMPIGTMNLEGTQDFCEARRLQNEATGHELRWKREVFQLASAVNDALKNIEAQETAKEQLEANEAAVDALNNCATKLAKTEDHPGFDPAYLFTTHMGKNSSVRLRDNCAKVRDNLAKLQPTLRWRMSVEKVQIAAAATRSEVAEASAEKDPEDRSEQLTDTLDGLKACVESGNGLAKLSSGSHAGAKPKKSELRALLALVAGCQKETQRVEGLIAAADKGPSSATKTKQKTRPKKSRKKKKRKKKR